MTSQLIHLSSTPLALNLSRVLTNFTVHNAQDIYTSCFTMHSCACWKLGISRNHAVQPHVPSLRHKQRGQPLNAPMSHLTCGMAPPQGPLHLSLKSQSSALG